MHTEKHINFLELIKINKSCVETDTHFIYLYLKPNTFNQMFQTTVFSK